ncbi:lipopolysaccharide transport periplasmic protein LptA [Alteromonas oceanisediminis]|uniref:lipopolysaccharide transport periplasmic protein LptA n=1 Tax=Alteromonas oceanisediminis TaxID=2836180 RepID=UPI001BDB3DA4|nr:lipopolysaccharide transport periplasmic protein LptA [Alteromonas oceanisediminis]MBT0585442.1 lipopolysaccharide transport periplasmic protein LptA [Alteromonas oceanisediminis]
MKKMMLLLTLTASAFALNVEAGESDFNKPITVDAQSQFVDGKNKTSVFREDVHITQGSMEIKADEVEVIATGGEGREIFIARGNPAIYAQDMDDGSRVSAQANTITYEVVTRAITLDGNAQLVRDTSMVQGDLIQFDMEKEQLLAESNDGEKRRVKTVFRPEAFKKAQNEKQPESQDNPF